MGERKEMEPTRIPEVLKDLAPYYHDIALGPGESTAPGQSRVADALEMFFPPTLAACGGTFAGKRILDLGCNCGGFSIAALRHGAKEVVGIDARAVHVKQARRLTEYVGLQNGVFYEDRIENVTEEKYGRFDVLFAFGVFYHLTDPISTIRNVARVVDHAIVVDSHVHFSSDTQQEDIPSWWMLADTDMRDFDGLRRDGGPLDVSAYLSFERSTPVDYGRLRGQADLSPQTARDLEFVRRQNRDLSHASTPEEGALAAADLGSLVMVPNKKALVRLLRYAGFDDVLEVVPQRFAQEPYLRRYRVGLLALRRREGGAFAPSAWALAAAGPW
jgi:2-polyprenyl-3-methyl-5-hydroxy-6-metoxy-1,4-benzoquinol methylase